MGKRFDKYFVKFFADSPPLEVYNSHRISSYVVHTFLKTYYHPFFPKLPGYAEYNRHRNLLLPAFRLLLEQLLRTAEELPFLEKDISIVDSFPIVVAKECCEKGYCASKEMYYYGLKPPFSELPEGKYHPSSENIPDHCRQCT